MESSQSCEGVDSKSLDENELVRSDARSNFDSSASETDRLLSARDPRIKSEEPVDIDTDGHKLKPTWLHWLIGPVFCLYIFGSAVPMVVIVEYTNLYCRKEEYQKSNLSMDNTSSPCDVNVSKVVTETEERASSIASRWNLYFSLAGGLPGIFANLFLGSFTDVLGRKFLIILTSLGTCIRLAITAIVIYLEADLVYLLIACLVEGCTGRANTFMSVSLAYAADITLPGKRRLTGIVVLEVLFGIFASVGVFTSGYMADGLGFETTFGISAGILAFGLVISVCFLPETINRKSRRNDKSIIDAFRVAVDFFIRNDKTNSRWKYQIVIIIHVLSNMSFSSRLQTETLYQLAHPFCWSPTKIGVYDSLRTIIAMCVSISCLKVLHVQTWVDEVFVCIMGNLAYSATYFWTAFISDDTEYYTVVTVSIFGPISIAMVRTILSHLTPSDKQGNAVLYTLQGNAILYTLYIEGAIFSAIGMFETMTSLVGSVSTSVIYAETVSIMRGLVFLVLGSYNVVATLLAIGLKIGWYMERNKILQSQ